MGEAIQGRGRPRRGWSAQDQEQTAQRAVRRGALPRPPGPSRPTCSLEGSLGGGKEGRPGAGWAEARGHPTAWLGARSFPQMGGVASVPPEPLCGCCVEASGPAEPVAEVGGRSRM